jgi:SM-20-related protein
MSAFPTPKPPSPTPPSPGPRASVYRTAGDLALAETAVAVKPRDLPCRCVVMDEFLAPAELQELLAYTLDNEAGFEFSEVVSPGVSGGAVDFHHRRSRVLMDLGDYRDLIVSRLETSLPRLLERLEREAFPISRVEAQITASNHGDYFHWHSDNAQAEVAARQITFVYFFNHEPRMFEGGELRLYDSVWDDGAYVPTGSYYAIAPRQNQAVVFDSSLAHEITPVICPSRRFEDSRFTVNGWFSG